MRIFAITTLLTVLPVVHAAIPLSGPCDPDFRAASCSPGNSKDDRPTAPAAAAKSPKSTNAPASSAPAPIKAAPAAKSPTDNRPESVTQVSLPAEESCPKTQRVESADEVGPLVSASLTIGP